MIYPQVQDGELFLRFPGGKVPMEELTAEQINLAIDWMVDHLNEYGENLTAMAEDCCRELDLYTDDAVPEDLFEIAYGVSQNDRQG